MATVTVVRHDGNTPTALEFTADDVRVNDAGALLLIRVDKKTNMAEIFAAIATGNWDSFEVVR